jgi:hypothetical protein
MAGAFQWCDDCDATGVLLTRKQVAGEIESYTRCPACLRAAEVRALRRIAVAYETRRRSAR